MANFNSSEPIPYVIDTSVVINLHASGCAIELLTLLPCPICIVDVAHDELAGGRGHGVAVKQAIDGWLDQKLATIVKLSNAANNTFETLVVGSAATTLDDGEAATIAYALDIGGIVVIDEGKARRLAASNFPALKVASSTDLLLAPTFIASLGDARASDAIYSALIRGRMRVPAERQLEVVHRIGAERAAMCHSLPETIRQMRK